MNTLASKEVLLLTKRSYLEMIERSLGSKMFRSLYMSINGVEQDILEKGNISCAYYVSSILLIFQLIRKPHATVSGTLRDMMESAWYETDVLSEGGIITWEDKYFPESGKVRGHVGFYIGSGLAVSNNPHTGTPTLHKHDQYMSRPIKRVFYHPKLAT